MTRTNEERETIININMADDTAYIFTSIPHHWRQLEKRGIKPTLIRRDSHGEIYAKDFEVPKRTVFLPRLPRPISEKQRQAGRDQARNLQAWTQHRIHSEV
jgi:hypothetical protein